MSSPPGQATADSEETAESLRLRAHKEFNDPGKSFHALTTYNLALLAPSAVLGDDNMRALIYSNRAEAYLKLRYFNNCLNNIQLAETHYPDKDKKIQQLHERRVTCLGMMETRTDCAIEPLSNPFMLSYESNEKLPFFIDGLQCRENARYGKHLVTTRDLRAGDVIAVVSDCWMVASLSGAAAACANCLNVNNFDLMRIDGCKDGE